MPVAQPQTMDVSRIVSVAPSLVILGLVALVAWRLALSRSSPPQKQPQRDAAARALALAVAAQTLHFLEESLTGFEERFPALFDLAPIPAPWFVAFNVAWIGIWIAAVPALRRAHPAAFFAAWFLALAGMLNGIAHPLLALVDGRYFPGLASSPFIAAAAWLAWRRLLAATDP